MNLYRKWLADFANDPETIADLKSIENDPAEIEDRFYRELEFGTAGMRGVLGAGTNRLNIYNVRRVSRALTCSHRCAPCRCFRSRCAICTASRAS